jgi:serine/threonine-protein kinase PknK
MLAPERLLERLDSALAVLTSGARDAPERHQTLRATIEWSYDLLEPRTRELFARLSVFSGGFPLEAAEEVCGAELDDLGTLVDYSLVKPIGDDRFFMLETIAEYALEKLREGNEGEELRRRPRRVLRGACRAGLRQSLRRGGRVVRTARKRP